MKSFAYRFGDEPWTEGGILRAIDMREARKKAGAVARDMKIKAAVEVRCIPSVELCGQDIVSGIVLLSCGLDTYRVEPDRIGIEYCRIRQKQLEDLQKEAEA